MRDLAAQLEAWRGRRLWLLGVGSPERGDDGFGVHLVRALQRAQGQADEPAPARQRAPEMERGSAAGPDLERAGGLGGPSPTRPPQQDTRLVDAGTSPERWVGVAVQGGCQELVFADAVEFGGRPGELLLAGTADLVSRPVAGAAHRVPLAVLAQYAEGLGARAWLLGVQPGSLARGAALSAEVAMTLDALVELLGRALGARDPEAGARAPATLDGVRP